MSEDARETRVKRIHPEYGDLLSMQLGKEIDRGKVLQLSTLTVDVKVGRPAKNKDSKMFEFEFRVDQDDAVVRLADFGYKYTHDRDQPYRSRDVIEGIARAERAARTWMMEAGVLEYVELRPFVSRLQAATEETDDVEFVAPGVSKEDRDD